MVDLSKTPAKKDVKKDLKVDTVFEKMATFFLVASVFLLPLFFVPSGMVSFQFTKGYTLLFLVTTVAVLWIISALRQGEFSIPKSGILLFSAIIPLATFASLLFSGSKTMSLYGAGLEAGTFATIFFSAILMALVPILLKTNKKLSYVFLAVFSSLAFVAMYQVLRLIFGPGFLSFGVLNNAVANVFGKWNDLGIFFGLGALMSMITLEFASMSKVLRWALYSIMAVSLFFLTLINFTTLWVVLGILSLILFIYLLSFGSDEKDTDKKKVSKISLVVIALSIIFIVAGTPINSFVSDFFGIAQIEARPSWNATLQIESSTYKDSLFFGAGPNRFMSQWLMHKPEGINNTQFWNTDFNTGIGLLPTLLVTTGLVGALSWILFLLLFLYSGAKSMFLRYKNKLSKYIIMTSFLSALYLWVFAITYNINSTLLALAFVFTGVFVGGMYQEGKLKELKIKFSNKSALNFFVTIISLFVIATMLIGAYFVTRKYIASVYATKSIVSFNINNDIDSAERQILRSVKLSKNDQYLQVLTDLRIAQLNILLSKEGLSENEIKSQFQQILGSAIQAANDAIKVDESNYLNHMALGRVYESIVPLKIEGAYESAKQAYESALMNNPRSPLLHLVLARLDSANGDNNGARAGIERALQEKPNYTEALFFLSQIEVDEGNISDAITSVETASVIEPNNPSIFFRLGFLKYNDEDYSGAIESFAYAVELNPLYSNARYFLGLSFYSVGRRSDAIAEFEEIERLNPGNEEIAFILTNLRDGRGPFTDVEEPLDDAPEDREDLPLDE